MACACLLMGASIAEAGITRVEVGIGAPNITGTRASTFQTAAGWSGTLYFDPPFKVDGLQPYLTTNYQPYKIANFTGGTLNLLDFGFGVKTSAGNAFWVLAPTMALQVGATYGWEDFATTTYTRNSKIYFTSVVKPGIDFPIHGQLSGGIEMPLRILFNTPGLTTVSGVFTLRWKL